MRLGACSVRYVSTVVLVRGEVVGERDDAGRLRRHAHGVRARAIKEGVK
jgi:hypothetical protein